MPQPYYNALHSNEPTGLGLSQTPSTCPNPLTPPPEQPEQYQPVQSQDETRARMISALSADNTAAAMAQMQEDSVYISPAASPSAMQDAFSSEDKDRMEAAHEEFKDGTKTPSIVNTLETGSQAGSSSSAPPTPVLPTPFPLQHGASLPDKVVTESRSPNRADSTDPKQQTEPLAECIQHVQEEARSRGLVPADLTFNLSATTQPWDFSNRRLSPEHPSHVFQPFSRFTGTQQSDRQIYNVDVTILTVDIAQCTMTGYLLIRGLTPEHDTLQTYFTGEIIGGPPRLRGETQYHTFRTANPTWGATEKTDLTHWVKFPAWRSLSSHAKRNINFEYPVDGGNWWEQENVFMRWKEHFLVPDHKTKSIAGASFEGFYYICLNQVQGRISGIYYHSKSEKFQQLELKHEGPPDIFNRGVTPCVEFR